MLGAGRLMFSAIRDYAEEVLGNIALHSIAHLPGSEFRRISLRNFHFQ